MMKLLKTITKISKWTFNLVLFLLVVTAGLFAAGHFELIEFARPFVVLSGSMEPEIKTGSVVFVYPRSYGYMEGDVITFMTSESSPPTTHRVSEITQRNGDLFYQTQGDANEEPDNGWVDPRNVLGRVVLTIPYIGYLADFAGQPIGFVVLVIIPATIIVYEELRTIKKEIVSILRKHNSASEENKQTISQDTQVNNKNKSTLLEKMKRSKSEKKLFMTAVALFLGLQTLDLGTQASYSDMATTTANYFGAASEYDSSQGGYVLPAECQALSGVITKIIEGTSGNDRLDGSSESELILGYGGNDRIDGGGGDDCIVGGDGDDRIDGGTGNDIILAGAGDDDVDGSIGDDLIYGQDGEDKLEGGSGEDEIYGGLGDDKIEGDSDNDILRGDEGNDEIEGGTGDDDIRGSFGDDIIEGESGDDLLSGGDGTDELDGGSGTDTCLSGEVLDSCEL